MNKGRAKYLRRSMRFAAAAVLTAALMAGQVNPALAEEEQASVEMMGLIPENITVDEPAALGEISLPDSDLGTLVWEDEAYVPSSRVEYCSAVFIPNEGVDISWMSGWDEEEGVWRGTVAVVTLSLPETEEDLDSMSEEVPEDGAYGGQMEEQDISPDAGEGQDLKTNEATDAENENTIVQDGKENGPEDGQSGTEKDGGAGADGSEAEISGGSDGTASDQPAVENPGSVTEEKENTELPDEEKEDPQEGDGQTPEAGSTDTGDSRTEKPEGGDSRDNDPGNGTGDQQPSDGADADKPQTDDQAEPQEPDNIFDRTEEFVDNRSVIAEENLSEEEMLQRAAENHTCDGIYVSGIDLPWYVQFRAASGEAYEFTNESGANIFRSYEFQLWDLKNDEEYKIPDGKYISVTVPVKEGYEYTVEHILPSGAVETIIPTLEGSTLIFSTHSFSPYGIAGNNPVVGGDISDKNYPVTPTPTPSPAATKKPTGTPAPTPGSAGTGNDVQSGGNAPEIVDKDHPGYVDDDKNGSNTSGGNSSGSSGETSGQQKDSDTETDNPLSRAVATGDTTLILPFAVLMVIDLLLIAAVFILKKRRAR